MKRLAEPQYIEVPPNNEAEPIVSCSSPALTAQSNRLLLKDYPALLISFGWRFHPQAERNQILKVLSDTL